MRRLAILACLAAGSLLASPALAQEAAAGDHVVVTLKSGASFRGTLVGQDERTLTLRSAAGTVRSLPLASVGRVEKAGSTPAAVPAAPATDEAAPAAPAARSAAPAAAPLAAPAHAVAAPVSGPSTGDGHVRVGLGVTLPAAAEFPSFYLPIQVSPGFRVEPEVGVVRLDVGGESATALQLGLGVFGTGPVAPQVGAYGGVRVQLQRLSATGSDSVSNVRVAGAVGGEWQPVPRVALGVEAQLAYLSIDRALTSSSNSSSGFSTAGLLFLRVYLN